MSQKYRYDEKTNSYIPIDDDGGQKNDQRPPRPPHQTSDDKLIGILIWAGQFIAPVIVSLIAYIYYENKNEYLRNIGKEALNFNISAILYSVIAIFVGIVTFGIGFIIFPLLAIYGIVIPIIGMLKASEMEVYIPQVTIRFLK